VGQFERLKDTDAMKMFYLVVVVSLLATPLQSQQGRLCKGNPDVVDQCFKVHGRARIVNGTGMVIWRIGTDRLLGVEDDENIPPNLSKALFKYDDKWSSDVYGDFEVCPLTKRKPEEMQMVCVASASHLIVKKPVASPSHEN
jgi:hypothetical protein